MDKYDALKIENQICFPLYACSREIIKSYKPFLDEIDLTYTQYLAMMVLWEHKAMNVKAMGDILYLDSGTMRPRYPTGPHPGGSPPKAPFPLRFLPEPRIRAWQACAVARRSQMPP